MARPLKTKKELYLALLFGSLLAILIIFPQIKFPGPQGNLSPISGVARIKVIGRYYYPVLGSASGAEFGCVGDECRMFYQMYAENAPAEGLISADGILKKMTVQGVLIFDWRKQQNSARSKLLLMMLFIGAAIFSAIAIYRESQKT